MKLDKDKHIESDTEAVLNALLSRTTLDPEIAERVQQRSQEVQKRLLEEHGVREIAVELIRETRDEA